MSCIDLTGQAELIRKGELSARELVEQSIAKTEASEPKLSALTTKRFEQALEAVDNAPSDSLFAGAPFMHKDLVDVPSFPRSDGTHFMSAMGRDDVLFQLALAIEEAAPWRDSQPLL